MNVVDSSGWLSYSAGDDNAGFFSTAIDFAPVVELKCLARHVVYNATFIR